MRTYLPNTLLLITALSLPLFLGGCAVPEQQEQAMKYPRKPADNPERKSGLPMLFYEAAEEDADINDVVVTPPSKKKEDQ